MLPTQSPTSAPSRRGVPENGRQDPGRDFDDDSPTIAGINSLLLPKIQAAGVTIVAQEKAPLDATDVTAQILRVKEKKPDAVLVYSLGGQLEVLFENTLYQQLRKTPRFSLASIGNQPATWKLAQPNALDGLVYVASIASNNPRSAELSKLLTAKQGGKFLGLTAYEAQGYDALQVIRLAIEKAGQDDPVLIKTALEHVSGFEAHLRFGQVHPQLHAGQAHRHRRPVRAGAGAVQG